MWFFFPIPAADGTVTGQYGFATADGYYDTTVYATDLEGRFHVLNRTRVRIAPPKRQSFCIIF